MKIPVLSIAVAVAAIATGVWIATKPGKPVENVLAESPAKKARHRNPTSTMERDEVIKMGPEDWKKRFAKSPSPGNPSTRADIVRLSGEMQEMVRAGSGPNSEEVLVYADAIRALLEGPGEE